MRIALAVALIETLLCVVLLMGFPHVHAKTIVVPDDYQTIQQAVDVAEPGDVILIKRGIYIENIVVENKSNIVIKSLDGPANTIIMARYGTESVIEIDRCRGILIDGLTIAGASAYRAAGVYIISSQNVVVNNSFITTNNVGLWIEYSSGIVVTHNSIGRGTEGVRVRYSSNITISSNTIAENYVGLEILDSKNLTIYLNNFARNSNNVQALKVEGSTWCVNGSGNFWEGHEATKPYVIDEANVDSCPLKYPNPPLVIPPMQTIVTYTFTYTLPSTEGGGFWTLVAIAVASTAIAVASLVYAYKSRKKTQTYVSTKPSKRAKTRK